MDKPDVTVLLTVRNEEQHIGATLKSILSQTYRNFEFWIIDDGSTDSTWKVIKSVSDSRIRSIRFTENQGMTKRLNWAIPQIKTAFVARMDSHNIADKERLGKQYKFMIEHSSVMAVGSNYRRITEDGKTLLSTKFPIGYQEIRRKLIEKNVFKHASMFFRREVYDLIGLYDPYFRVAQDYDFILRVAAKCPVRNLPEDLITEIYLTASLSQRFRARSAWEALVSQWNALTKYSYPLWQAIYLIRGLAFLGKSLVLKLALL